MKFGFYKRIIAAAVTIFVFAALAVSVFGSVGAITLTNAEPKDITASSTSYASISADPPRLSSAGYVTVTIKLFNRNSGSVNGNIGFIPSISEPGPIVTEPPESTVPPESDPPETDVPPVTNPPVTGGAYTNVVIENSYGVSFQTSDVAAGATGTYRASMMVSETMIGQPLAFKIIWYDTASGTSYYQNLSLTIQRSGGDTAYLRLSRTANVSSAAIGETVEFTYTMVNTGTRRLNSITLIDEKIGGRSPLLPAFSLASGERKEFVYRYTMQGTSVVSNPTVTFTPEGSSSPLSVSITKLTIGLVNAQLSKNVTIGNITPDGVAFTLFLTNNGSQNLSGLTVKDDLGATLASGFSLAIGESRIIEHFVPNPDSVRYVVFSITGTYSSGKEFRDNTQSYPVRPYIDPTSLGLSFHAEVLRQLNSDNHIVLTFTVMNTGRVPYTDVILTEAELGYTLYEIATLPPNSDSVSFNVDLTIDGPREMAFYLTAVDPSGNTYRYDALLNAEYSDLASVIPNATPEPGTEQSGGITIVDFNIDRQISERGKQLIKWWKKLEIIFFVAVGVIAILGAVEIWLYFSKKKKDRD